MPHECTECGKGFPDGSKEMLGGCPACGGKKFQYLPKTSGPASEDPAQSSARTEMVDDGQVPSSSPDVAEPAEPAPDSGPADLAELRERLDSQFESIKIVEPGQYELNLMELYDRDTYVISLQEDGRYVIDVPEAWRRASPES